LSRKQLCSVGPTTTPHSITPCAALGTRRMGAVQPNKGRLVVWLVGGVIFLKLVYHVFQVSHPTPADPKWLLDDWNITATPPTRDAVGCWPLDIHFCQVFIDFCHLIGLASQRRRCSRRLQDRCRYSCGCSTDLPLPQKRKAGKGDDGPGQSALQTSWSLKFWTPFHMMEPKKAQKQHDTFCSRTISGFFWWMLGQLHSKGMHDLTAMGKLKGYFGSRICFVQAQVQMQYYRFNEVFWCIHVTSLLCDFFAVRLLCRVTSFLWDFFAVWLLCCVTSLLWDFFAVWLLSCVTS
jgi:hypothetical protein